MPEDCHSEQRRRVAARYVDLGFALLRSDDPDSAREACLAFKNRYIAGAGGFSLVGTAETIAGGLARWTRGVMPLLERAGLRNPFPARR